MHGQLSRQLFYESDLQSRSTISAVLQSYAKCETIYIAFSIKNSTTEMHRKLYTIPPIMGQVKVWLSSLYKIYYRNYLVPYHPSLDPNDLK
ncbi:hypothetical protein CEXT_269181 [Caerostris extrusa]|uniref:Uncharacterized protein n=1 Tax=Caerostris extrusa TaxID=172846 RepID=A0AAV4RF22_CAEEX|nr:hypothetical protein CEXT_269181 [Caerostris extrusa]